MREEVKDVSRKGGTLGRKDCWIDLENNSLMNWPIMYFDTSQRTFSQLKFTMPDPTWYDATGRNEFLSYKFITTHPDKRELWDENEETAARRDQIERFTMAQWMEESPKEYRAKYEEKNLSNVDVDPPELRIMKGEMLI